MRDIFALFLLALELPGPLFWLAVHPATRFWRRYPRATYYLLGPAIWLAVALALIGGRSWWLAERFSRHWAVALAGVVFLLAGILLTRHVRRALGWRALLGLPQLFARWWPGRLVVSGPYEWLRHPRYLAMMLTWWGAVLVSGATRLVYLVVGMSLLAWFVTELEERELLSRFGAEYANYRQRVPRFLPFAGRLGRELRSQQSRG